MIDARRSSTALVAVGAIVAAVLVGRPPGLGVTVIAVTVLAITARPRDPWAIEWLLAAVALCGVATLRAAGWIVWPCLVAATALGSLAAAGGAAWWPMAAGVARVTRVDRGLVLIGRTVTTPVRGWRGPLVGTGITAVLLAVFVPLFATADAAFAHLLGEALPQVDQPIARLGAWLGVIAVGGGLLWAGRSQAVTPLPGAAQRLGRVETHVPLAALVALFAAFVALQITALYAGHDYVLRTAGLTYAEYAREGFAQLLAAAALTLALTAAALLAFAISDPDRRIAVRNLDRYEETGDRDPRVLSRLSADAAPALPCNLTRRLREQLAEPDGIAAFNVARARARDALARC